jgi:hypothetical protein
MNQYFSILSLGRNVFELHEERQMKPIEIRRTRLQQDNCIPSIECCVIMVQSLIVLTHWANRLLASCMFVVPESDSTHAALA